MKTEKSELLMRRQFRVSELQNEVFGELFRLNPSIAQALTMYQAKKSGTGVRGNLVGRSRGYDSERQYYLKQGKVSGSSVSIAKIHAQLRTRHRPHRWRDIARNRLPGAAGVVLVWLVPETESSDPRQRRQSR